MLFNIDYPLYYVSGMWQSIYKNLQFNGTHANAPGYPTLSLYYL